MRSANLADVPAIRGLLAAAFENDPLFTWIFPDDEHRLNATAAWLGLFAEAYVTDGRVDVLEHENEIAAVALWRFPGVEIATAMPTVAGLVAAFVGTGRATVIFEALGEIAAAHPTDPYAYLHLLAVSPRFQRRGLGELVVAPGIQAASAAGVNAELATMNPANVAFYRSLGFAVTHELALKPDGPQSWVLAREPN